MTTDDERREAAEAAQRQQQEAQHAQQARSGILPSPPPYEVPETPLERLDLGLGYMAAVVGGAFLLNLAILVVIAVVNGG